MNENTAEDGEFILVWPKWGRPQLTTAVSEIWGSDNQLYGYVVYQTNAVRLERVEMVDDSTIQISYGPLRAVPEI